MIPKIIHQVWVGPDPIPKYCQDCTKTWKALHPDYTYMLWTDNNLPDLPSDIKFFFNLHGKIKKYAFQADILRYYVVNKFGGIYADVDIECLKNFNNLFDENTDLFFTVEYLDAPWLPNGIFAGAANSAFFNQIVENIITVNRHGPAFFGNEIKKYLKIDTSESGESVLEACKNNPSIKCILNNRSIKTLNKYYYHHYLKSWVPANEGIKVVKYGLDDNKIGKNII